MGQGYFSIVLHAHLPYVRHKEEGRLEELWLYEAISESYIPLLWNLEEQDHMKALTLSFSPPLMEMLNDPLLQGRYLQYIEKVELLLIKEMQRKQSTQETKLVNFYIDRLQKIKNTFLKWEKNLLNGFRHFAEIGKLNCICSSATHAFLPYIQSKEAIKAQIKLGIETFKKYFGYKPRGFWLPECGYAPGIDRILFEEGIRYSFVDEHGIKNRDPNSEKQMVAPVFSPHGVILFPRNSVLCSQVWSSLDGYPGDFDYREFYRDIAYDREWNYIQPFLYGHDIRHDTGLKYHRVTGLTDQKEFYDRKKALAKARDHSQHFINVIKSELKLEQSQSSVPNIIVTPFDTELFGHWWFEGPNWLKYLVEECIRAQISLITPDQFIDRYDQGLETAHISFNTWGRNGYGEVWVNHKNSWIYRYLHWVEKDLISLITQNYRKKDRLMYRCLKQMAREWLLATSSDWSFMIDAGSAKQYANERIKDHLERYEDLRELLVTKQINEVSINSYEEKYPFLDDIDLKTFISIHDEYVPRQIKLKENNRNNKKVLMLAWEFPPMVVGGLSRHVFDLTKALSKQGLEVHVITTYVKGYLEYEIIDNVHVHRVKSLQPDANEFYHWVGSLNMAICDYVLKLSRVLKFDIIHAHDWLVSVAAKALKKQLHLPLIATIHATEHGRNDGINTQLQHDIHQKELELCADASKVIVCSKYMKDEVIRLFKLSKEKVNIIHNGVDVATLTCYQTSSQEHYYTREEDIIIFSVGRMVKEKGFQTIIDSAPEVLTKYPNVKFIIAGKGPMLEEYQAQVVEKGLESSVHFIGFIDDFYRNEILNNCNICLFPSMYEPFGIVALESMAVGKPTIVSDTGGLAEIIIDGVTGLKITPNNIESLKKKVISCIENKEFAREIAENGKALVKSKYSWEIIAKQTGKIYEGYFKGNLKLEVCSE